MDKDKERKLTVLEKAETVEVTEIKSAEKALHSNPITAKLMKFHLEKSPKFTVKDLFKKQ